MLRWTVQTVRVAGGCDSVLQRLRSAASSATSTNAVVVTLCGPSAPSASSLSHSSLHIVASRRWTSGSRLMPTSSPTLDLGKEESQSTPSISVPPSEEADEPAVSDMVSPDNTPAALPEAPHHSSMAKLRTFLDLEFLQDDSRRYTVRHIRHRYLLWKRENVLHHLGPFYMSSIIRLLGSLSISIPGKSSNSLYSHRRLPDMPESNYGPHWDTIIMICRDKQRLEYPLSTSDRYWLMRARIGKHQEYAGTSSAESEEWLSAAGRSYRAIRDRSPHYELHLPYLQVLAAQSSETHTEELATHLTAILAWSGCMHPSLRRLFFQSIISHTDFTAASKDEILLAISDRVVDSLPHNASASNQLPAADPGIHSLVDALEHAMLENDARSELAPDTTDGSVLRWARSVTQRVFATAPDHRNEDRTGDLRWNCLVLLALVRTHSAEWSGNSAQSSSDPIRRAAVMEWQTVCIIAAVENLLGARHTSAADALPRDVMNGFCGVLRKLWGDWTAIPPSDAPPRPLYVSRLICASFLKLAGRLEDKVLLDSCREFCMTSRLWSFQESIPASTAGLRELAMEQLYAALRCGTFFERALVDLVVCTTDMELLTAAIDTSVTRYARSDPEHAQELLAWARNRGIPPSGEAIARVGIALARHGTSSYLDRYTAHSSLSAEQRAHVVMAYLQAYVRHGRRFMEPRAVADLCPSVIVLSTHVADPTPLLRCLRSALLVLIREGYSARVVGLVEEVAANHPSVSPEATYSRILSALLRHRRFQLARRRLAHFASLYPARASQWQDTVILRSVQGGASRLASEVATGKASRSIRLVAKAASRIRRPGMRSIPPTLSLLSLYGTTPAPAVALHAIRGLLSVGRLHAAKKLYEHIARQESAEVRTAAGNMILSAAARRAERGQRVRDTAHVYRTLAEQHSFVPDRVTINILLKVLLSDKDLDVAKARTLFGVVVRMGYPTGAVAQGRAEGGPGTTSAHSRPKASSPLVLSGIEVPWPTSPIMYMRHVRPLYKTFIKAFYGLGDVDAARKVMGILRSLEAQNGRWTAEGRDWVVAGGEPA